MGESMERAVSAVKTSVPETLWGEIAKAKSRAGSARMMMDVCWLPSSASISIGTESRARRALRCETPGTHIREQHPGLWDTWDTHTGQTHMNAARTCRPGTGSLGITPGNSALALPGCSLCTGSNDLQRRTARPHLTWKFPRFGRWFRVSFT